MNTSNVLDRARPASSEQATMARADRAAFRRHAVTWLPWSNPMPPATTADEARFVADLRTEASDRREPHRRSDTTALLAALRGGLDVETLLEQAPGLRPSQLWSAYFDLEERRFESEAAWRCIVESPTPATMHDLAPIAAQLVPVPVGRLRQVAFVRRTMVPAALAQIVERIETTHHAINAIERALDLEDKSSDRARTLGRQLLGVDGDPLFDRSYHLPRRVGALTPDRVAQLLGETSSSVDEER